MIFRYQVLVKLPAWAAPVAVPVHAESEEQAEGRIRALYPGEPHLHLSVGPPESDMPRAGLDPQEQAWYLGCEMSLLKRYKSDGLLPQLEHGQISLIPPAVLDRFNVQHRFGLTSWEDKAA